MRLGTIGTGMIVREILKAVSRVDGVSCAAVYSRKQETGQRLADEFGIARVYTALDALLADDAIDTIYIASPNSLHTEQAKRALAAGKHVLLEKPFTPTRREAEELFALAEENGVFLLEAITTESLPHYKLIRAQLPQLGRLRMVQCAYSQYSSRYDALKRGETPNVFNPAFAGGALQDINLYNIHFCIGLFGKPQSAVYYPNRHANGIDTSGVLVMRYPDFLCVCEGAKDVAGVNSAQLQGENGYLYIKDGCNWCREVTLDAQETRTWNLQEPEKHWQYEMEELPRIIAEKNWAEYERRKRLTLDVVEVMEQARTQAGILFPPDKETI